MAKRERDADDRIPNHGEKTIEVTIRFLTDKIAPGKGHIRPKHAWTSGFVSAPKNASHGIAARNPHAFNSLMELPAAIERVLIEHGIVLRPDRRMQKYFAAAE